MVRKWKMHHRTPATQLDNFSVLLPREFGPKKSKKTQFVSKKIQKNALEIYLNLEFVLVCNVYVAL